MITKENKITAVETEDGAGVRIKRLFPSPHLANYDPFVLFDEFFLLQPSGFPTHPHRGFEAITYLLEGGFRHRDSLGNDTTVLAGGMQRFSAGRGLEHSELPGTEGMNHGIQLWVNLPRSLKGMEPDYQQVNAQDIPVTEHSHAIIRTIVGDGSPVFVHTKLIYQDVILATKHIFDLRIPGTHHGFVYVVSGLISVEKEQLGPGEAFFMSHNKNAEITAVERSRFIFLSGKPHRETIVLNGSFVD